MCVCVHVKMCACGLVCMRRVHMCVCEYTHSILDAEISEFPGIGCFTISIDKKNDEGSKRSSCRTFITCKCDKLMMHKWVGKGSKGSQDK